MGCDEASPAPSTKRSVVQAPALGATPGAKKTPDFDLSGVIDRVHFAYRANGNAHTGGHSTYAVHVEEGRVALTPYRYASNRHEKPASARDDRRTRRANRAAEQPIAGDALELVTRSIVRGATALSSQSAPTASVGQDGSMWLARGGVREQLKNSDAGVEQSWHFHAVPAGHGDVVIRVAVRGERYVGETASGLHFASANDALGFRYGNATWVDASGVKTSVAASWERGEIVLRVPRGVIDASSYPALLDPVVGPEFGMDAPVYGPAAGGGGTPWVSWNGTQALVVWSDSGVRAARVNADGTVADPNGITVNSYSSDDYDIQAAWNGSQWLVVWADGRNGYDNYDVYGARVDSDGSVADVNGIAISTGVSDQAHPSVSWGNNHWLVAWDDNSSAPGTDYDIYGARVDANGTVVDTNGFAISTAAYWQGLPAIAWNGSQWLVVWVDSRGGTGSNDINDICAARVNTDGTVADTAGFAVSAATNTQFAPAVAGNGTQWLVAWTDQRSVSTSDIYAARVNADGSVADATGFAVSTAANDQSDATVAWNGTQWLVAWSDRRSGSTGDVYAARVNTDGTLADASGIAISSGASDQQNARAAWMGTQWLLTWTDYRNGAGDIYAARLDTNGTLADANGFPVTTRANHEAAPGVAWNGSHWLVVWEDARGANTDLYAVRVDADGIVVDPSAIAVTSGGGEERSPHVSWGSTHWLVVWRDEPSSGPATLRAARIASNGTITDPSGFSISSSVTIGVGASCAWNGTQWVVAWSDYRGANSDIYAARIDTNGTAADGAGILISGASGDQVSPSVASVTTTSLIVWSDYRSGTWRVYGARLNANGSVADPSGIAITTLSTTGSQWPDLDVAAGPSQWLVAWESSDDVYAARVSTNGAVTDANGFIISAEANTQTHPRVAWSGTQWLVAWSDNRHGTKYTTRTYATRVTTVGTVLDANGFLVSDDGDTQNGAPPALAGNGQGQVLVAYPATDPLLRTVRLRGRLISMGDTVCDGIDDDGDGSFDEDYLAVATVCGVGACASAGVTSCTAGAELDSCVPSTAAPSDTTCDDVDDDCDGAPDDDYVGATTGTTCGIGACVASSHLSCVGGNVMDVCTPGAPALNDVTCNDVDDDCDGNSDEDYVSAATTCGAGACASTGVTSCASGNVLDSCIPGTPAANDTTCNDVDDDCSGAKDEDYVSAATSCGVGACASTGALTCVAGSVIDTCTAGAATSGDATCNDVDDDCNGAKDEDYVATSTTCGVGACASTGSTSCASGAVQDSCTAGAPLSGTDTTCDSVDDDCDGTADDDAPDTDSDGDVDCHDNCAAVANANQLDTDLDGLGDACDPTPQPANPDDDAGSTTPDAGSNTPDAGTSSGADASLMSEDASTTPGSGNGADAGDRDGDGASKGGDGGCGCRVAGTSTTGRRIGGWLWSLAALGLFIARRRRR